MDRPVTPLELDRRKGCGIALAIGVLTPAVSIVTFSLLTGRPLNLRNEWVVFLFQMAICGAPYALLALAGIRARAPWFIALALTLSLWSYSTFAGVSYQWNPDGSGANIGLGILLVFSPIIIALISFTVYALGRRRS
jgi:hypothetical protein